MNGANRSNLSCALAALFITCLALLAFAVVPPGRPAQRAWPAASAARHPCTPEFDQAAVPAVLGTANACSAAASETPFVVPASKPHRHGYCRCSCGYPCTSSADCGGVSCDPFITCC